MRRGTPGSAASFALAVGLLVAGCAAAERPFDRIALIPSYWDIVAVSGTDVVGSEPRVLTIGRSNSARVALGCGEIDLRYVSDTGGAALSFGEERVAAPCLTAMDDQDGAIRAALGQVARWRVTSDTTIEMLDGNGRPVLALQETGCDCPHTPLSSASASRQRVERRLARVVMPTEITATRKMIEPMT